MMEPRSLDIVSIHKTMYVSGLEDYEWSVFPRRKEDGSVGKGAFPVCKLAVF